MILDKAFFPTLVNNPELVYFDSAASTQTHTKVIEGMFEYYTHYRSNVGRGSYSIADRATEMVELGRERVAKLINAPAEQVLFTTGATQGLNWVAQWNINVPTVIIFEHEHNANIAPWVAQGRTVENDRLRVAEMSDDGKVNLSKLYDILSNVKKGSLLSFAATSNLTGITQEWPYITKMAHDLGISVCIDFCQTVAHAPIDLTENPVEYAVFSGHKMYGPTGIGVLYTSFDLNKLKGFQYGGGGVTHVDWNSIVFSEGYLKHQSGTPDIANIIGMGLASELIQYVGFTDIVSAETDLKVALVDEGLFDIPNLNVIQEFMAGGVTTSSIITMYSPKYYSLDIGETLSNNIALRTGKVCAHPYATKLSLGKGVVRISLAPYNTREECVKLVEELNRVMYTLDKQTTH